MADLAFMDWESRGADLPLIGSLNYALHPDTKITLLTWALDREPVRVWMPEYMRGMLPPALMQMLETKYSIEIGPCPEPLRKHVEEGGYIVAWNAAFDRHMWQQVAAPELGFPDAPIPQWLCAMAQGQASNLPGGLNQAARVLKLGEKVAGGSTAMKAIADITKELPVDEYTWDTYVDYGIVDTALMRDIWYACRPLAVEEWREYWASERINDRGIRIDKDVCIGALKYREEDSQFVRDECARLTDGDITKPTLTKRINEWVFPRLPETMQRHMIKEADPETGEPIKLTLARPVVIRLLSEIDQSDAPPADEVCEFIELLEFGRSSSAIKFQKMLNQAVDGRLCSSYVFNGAGQTGRASSRGIQLHNLPRDRLKNETEILGMIADQVDISELRKAEVLKPKPGDTEIRYAPISTILSRSIRPTLIAAEHHQMVWGDWSAIEARVLPWLANSKKATATVLQPFADGEDLYILNAADIFGVYSEELYARYQEEKSSGKGDEYSKMRQCGKIGVLSLGFGGSVGAYKAMARGYGMVISDEEALRIVHGWRDRNRWARSYWDKLEAAAFSAIRNPETVYTAGRVAMCYYPQLMGGSLVGFLPDGRPLMYPMAQIVLLEDNFGNEKPTITYLNKNGRSSTWYGKFAENFTQATAASLLRAAMTAVEATEYSDMVILHTHDELLGEVPDAEVEKASKVLHDVMATNPPWSTGLPLSVDMEHDWYYHK